MTPKKSMYEKNGVKTANSTDFTSFIARVLIHKYTCRGKPTSCSNITIPKPIRVALKLEKGDFLEVAIRKASKEILREYFLPRKCPNCGKFVSVDSEGLTCSVCGWKNVHPKR